MQRNALRCNALACDDKDTQEEKNRGGLVAPEEAKQTQAVDGEGCGACGGSAWSDHHRGKAFAEIANSFLAARSVEMVDAERHAILTGPTSRRGLNAAQR